MRPRSHSRPQRRSQILMGAAATVAFATGIVLADVGGTGRSDDWVLVGLTIVLVAMIVGATAWLWFQICARFQPLDDVYTQGLEMGRESGYREGRRTSRPVVVPATCPHCGGQVVGRITG